MFSEYRITSPYGARIHPIRRTEHFHTGIDMVKSHQAPIYAFMEGLVIHAGRTYSGTGLGGFGLSVVIQDEHDHVHLYAHLDSVSVRKGRRVVKGDEVGKQGMTGNVTGSHLHYEVRTRPSPSFGWSHHTDPEAYLKGLEEKSMDRVPIYIDDEILEVPSILHYDSQTRQHYTLVHIRPVLQALGYTVNWDNEAKAVRVSTGKK